jgi:hypothetical protein
MRPAPLEEVYESGWQRHLWGVHIRTVEENN